MGGHYPTGIYPLPSLGAGDGAGLRGLTCEALLAGGGGARAACRGVPDGRAHLVIVAGGRRTRAGAAELSDSRGDGPHLGFCWANPTGKEERAPWAACWAKRGRPKGKGGEGGLGRLDEKEKG